MTGFNAFHTVSSIAKDLNLDFNWSLCSKRSLAQRTCKSEHSHRVSTAKLMYNFGHGIPVCTGGKSRVEYVLRAASRDSEQIVKRIGGLEWENHRLSGIGAAVGVRDNSTMLGSEPIVSQIFRRISGGRRGKSVNESGDLGAMGGPALMEQC